MSKKVIERIRERGFRATDQRILLVSYLERKKRPVSIRELSGALHKRRIDQATVYRMIEAFARAGLVREIGGVHGEIHYELNPDVDHDHIICVRCHRVEDIPSLHEKGIEQKALRTSHAFSTIQAHALTLYGLCRSCANE